MIKSIWTIKRADGVSHAELAEFWEHKHAPHITQLVQPLKYAVTLFDDAPNLPYDGLAELWLRDADHFNQFWGPDPNPHINDDGFAACVDQIATRGMFADEYVQLDGSPGGAKLSILLSSAEGTSRDDLFQYWLATHAPNITNAAAAAPSVTRYVVNHSTQARENYYDGLAEIYGESIEAINTGLATATPDDMGTMIDAPGILILPGRELQIVP